MVFLLLLDYLEMVKLSISKFHEKTPLVVIVGSEDKGISLLTQKKCDFLLRFLLKVKHQV